MDTDRWSPAWRGFPWFWVFLPPLYALVFCLLFLDFAPGKAGIPLSLRKWSGEEALAVECRLPGWAVEGEAGDGADENLGGGTVRMEDYLQPGDILLGRCRLSLVPSLNPAQGYTHAAIYVGEGDIVVAANPYQGTVRAPVGSWEYPRMTWVTCLRVTSATEEERKEAARFAEENIGRPYDLNWFSEQEDGPSWYCSELVWAAYLHATGRKVDLESGMGLFGVSPDDIYLHSDTSVVGGHYERKPDTIVSLLAKALALCALFGTAAVVFR